MMLNFWSDYEEIFRTEKGSVYLRNRKTRLWIRRGKEFYGPAHYVGSIDRTKNDAFIQNQDRYYPHILWEQLYNGNGPGFVPEFQLGLIPLGLWFNRDDILLVDRGKVKVSYKHGNFHVGHSIVEIFRHLSPWPEQII